MYVCRFQNVVLRCPTPRFHCFLSSHWPSIYLPSSFSSVFLVLSFVSASTSMLFWVIFLLPFFGHGRPTIIIIIIIIIIEWFKKFYEFICFRRQIRWSLKCCCSIRQRTLVLTVMWLEAYIVTMYCFLYYHFAFHLWVLYTYCLIHLCNSRAKRWSSPLRLIKHHDTKTYKEEEVWLHTLKKKPLYLVQEGTQDHATADLIGGKAPSSGSRWIRGCVGHRTHPVVLE